ncbi:hypothetical protein EPUS_02930 [Endocarpon pusillum Z07020]|uniref:Nuclear pore complex protein Nup85 n=1 Tax=Endocarpon pusillum (strain Z07020 / HMAS-L-300199) TaxID=1263415 RepID=U1HSI1_ENDPU|nr:uncharacterized protein EPUS_02930 [Endocarpon pusillum Z07020]ERF72139.1 hypothetical protein EPUS_02930 [Endocarpon pusillum Z07020]
MSTFQVPFSSSPPATPDTKSQFSRGLSTFSDMADNPSTTPAGPPPNSAASFTPAGPPPSTIFGSSHFGSDVGKLKFTKPIPQAGTRQFPTFQPPRTKNGTPGGLLGKNNFGLASSSILSQEDSLDQSQSQEPDHEDEDEFGGDYDESMQLGESAGNYGQAGSPAFKGFTAINNGDAPSDLRSSLLDSLPNPTKRSKLQRSIRSKGSAIMARQLPRKGKPDVISNIARDLASRTQPATLTEPDPMIIRTEDILVELHRQMDSAQDEDVIRGILAVRSLELMRLWNSCAPPEQNLGEGIGPGSGANALQNATYLSSLLLALRHPPLLYLPAGATGRAPGSKALTAPTRPIPIPKVLVDWLNRYHISYDDLLDAVRSTRPNCTAHESFWDVAFGMLVRGQVLHVIQLFSDADFQHAASALDDGEDEPGYHGAQLQAVQSAVDRARELLRGCPATKGDWQIHSSDWDLFRKRVSSELEHLAISGGVDDEEDSSNTFQAENFGLQKTGRLLPRSAQAAHRQLPWSIYQKLKVFYGILLGSADEIIAQSQDWLEATAALTVWWDGTEDLNIATWSINVSRAQRADASDRIEDPYLARISAAFLCVTDPDYEDSFYINSLSPLEVGLASILQGDTQAVLSSLRTFSLVIAASVAEIGSLAGWLEPPQANNAPGLDQEDLIVLSYGVKSQGITKDDIILRYSRQLYDRQEFVDDEDTCEGWELAISVASRIDDRQLVTDTITNFLNQLHLDSQDRLDKLLALCSSLGLEAEARKVSERFADHLSSSTTLYGPALLCYARSHASGKIRQLMDLLVSYCLVQSAAYPANSELDEDLRVLAENPKRALSKLNQVDAEAAAMLQFYLAGYACLRRFYNLRDEEMLAKAEGRTPNPKSRFARRKAAAKALTAVINSAADAIYGSLYDAERESAIQVDGLLTLLGEVTALVGGEGEQDARVLTAAQMYDILAAIEHLQTVNPRVFEATEDCLSAALRNYRGSAPPSPRAMLKKSVSSATEDGSTGTAFSFSLLGSEMLASRAGGADGGGGGGGKSIGSSGVLVPGKVERGWDWRSRFADKEEQRAGHQLKGHEVLAYLRRHIAMELALAELEEGEA